MSGEQNDKKKRVRSRPPNGTRNFVSSIYFRNAEEVARVQAAAKKRGVAYTAFIREASLALADRVLREGKKKKAA